jgi:predicted regulator of Ras-like GTPase activity (Roadblock/LC7/MglB family)
MKQTITLSKTALEAIRRQLMQFGEASPGIQLAVLSTADGFEIASFLSPSADAAAVATRVAAMTSSLTAIGDAITRETGLHGSRNLIIESDNGIVLMVSLRDAKPKMALAIVANKQAILGHLLWATRNTGAAIERIATT